MVGQAGSRRRHIAVLLTLVVASSALAGRPDFDRYMQGLLPWNEYTPILQDADVEISEQGPTPVNVGTMEYTCTYKNYELTRTPDEIVTLSPDVDALWVGSLLQGKGYIGGIGTLQQLPISKRAPLTLYVDLLGEDITRTITQPNGAKVQQAVAEIISGLQESGNKFAASTSFTLEESHTVDESLLRIGISARFVKSSIKSQLETSRSMEENTTTVSFYQRLFTLTMVPPERPSDFLSNSFTQKDFKWHLDNKNIGSNNLPVYVSSVTYGRVLLFNLTSTAETSEVRAALNASYSALRSGGTFELSAKHKDIFENARLQVVAIGGTKDAAEAAIRSGNFRTYFDEATPLTAAQPLSYSVRTVSDGANASISETTTYNKQTCIQDGGVETLQSSGAYSSFSCRAGGELMGYDYDNRLVKQEVAPSRTISIREYKYWLMPYSFPYREYLDFAYFDENGRAWPSADFKLRADSWSFACRGESDLTPAIDAKLQSLHIDGPRVRFACVNGGRIMGLGGSNLQKASVSFNPGQEIRIGAVERSILLDTNILRGPYVHFKSNRRYWPDNGWRLLASSWGFRCN